MKTPGAEDTSAAEAESLLEGIAAKTAKPSVSSEDDKNDDYDLLSKLAAY